MCRHRHCKVRRVGGELTSLQRAGPGAVPEGRQEGAVHRQLVSVHAYPSFPSPVHPDVQPLRIHCSSP